MIIPPVYPTSLVFPAFPLNTMPIAKIIVIRQTVISIFFENIIIVIKPSKLVQFEWEIGVREAILARAGVSSSSRRKADPAESL